MGPAKLITALLLICSQMVSAQNDSYFDHATGIQLGYARCGYNQVELGMNHYWSYVRHRNYDDSLLARSHTFGPFASAAFTFKSGSGLYVGPKLGFNYAFPSMLSFRISPSVEYIPRHEWYAGCDIGVSLLGVYLYYGYYASLQSTEISGYNNHRIGIRFILNEAPFNTSGAVI